MAKWLEEIDLKLAGPPISMGVRKLRGQPWLYIDEHREFELRLKAELTEAGNKEVFLARPDTKPAGDSVVALIEGTGVEIIATGAHPLERSGLSVQEDLCLIKRDETKRTNDSAWKSAFEFLLTVLLPFFLRHHAVLR